MSRRRVRRWVIGSVVILLCLGVVGLVALLPYSSDAASLRRGKDALVQAQNLVLAGDISGAAHAFRAANTAFREVLSGVGGTLLRAESHVPFLGRTPKTIVALAEIGSMISRAGEIVTDGVARLPRGLASIYPGHGHLDLGAVSSLGRAVHEARHDVEAAWALAEALPGTLVIAPVARARDLVREKLRTALGVFENTDALLHALPAFAGANGPRRYFVAAQNPAELRGTGGFIGEYAILTADRGVLTLSPFQEAGRLSNAPTSSVPAPSPEFAEIYDRFGGAGFWPNINMTPDAPTAGALIESLYRKVTGIRLDGTIFLDPRTLADMLQATGPIVVPSLGRTLSATDVVPYVANQLYFDQQNRTLRKRALGLAAGEVWRRFLDHGQPTADIRALTVAAHGGDLVIHAADPSVQRDLDRAGVTGRLGFDRGQYVGVFLSSADATKMDFYLRERIRYDVQLERGGGGRATAEILLKNAVDHVTTGSEVFGPAGGTGLRVGESQTFATVYCGRTCVPVREVRDGRAAPLEEHTELGYPLTDRYVRLLPGRAAAVAVTLFDPRAWTDAGVGGVYTLRIQAQPMINPPFATVTVRIPGGMRVVAVSPSMRSAPGVLTWSGSLQRSQDFTIRLAA